jgi:hypothetical protein
MTAHQLFIINTHYSPEHLSSTILPKYGRDEQIGPMRSHSGAILAFLDPEVQEIHECDESSKCKILDYPTFKFKPKDTEDEGIFFALRSELTTAEHYKYISDTLYDLTISNLFSWDEVKINIPTSDDGVHKGVAFLNFSSEVSIDTITKVCVFLNGFGKLRCSWTKKRAPKLEVKKVLKKQDKLEVKKVLKKGKTSVSIPSTPTNAWC